MSREFVLVLSAISFLISSEAQIVTIEPAFFTIDSTITITYDATMGSRGLVGVNQVYAHTGVITTSGGPGNWQNVQGEWGTDDERVKMTSIGDNKHQLTINIRAFYELSDNVTVEQLAFVFRNVDGSREGKSASNGDIFVDVPRNTGFNAFFQVPSNRQLVVDIGETILIDVVTSEEADIALFDNNVLIAQEKGRQLKIDYDPVIQGNHVIHFTATSGSTSITDSISFIYHPVSPFGNLPEGMKLGLNRISDTEAIIALNAPDMPYVILLSNVNDYLPRQEYSMTLALDEKIWWIKLENLNPQEEYFYQFLLFKNLKIADPLSELIIDPIHDAGIENFENLPRYPQGKTDGQLSYFKSASDNFEWTDQELAKPEKEDLVIYELLLRDFLHSNSYNDLSDTLTYLHRLGVNAIELMPIQEFETNDSWGYNPSYHMALDKYYGSPEDFKEFVNEAHAFGMVVIQDVVFNHAFGQSPLVQMYWDEQQRQPSANSPYFNQTARHPFNIGFDFNHESEDTKNYVKRVLEYWMNEYHIDGFRFDLSKGFTQNFSTNDQQMSAYDPSRIAILKEYAQFIWDIDPRAYVILEHFAGNTEERELASEGMLLWSNGNHNFNEATMGYHDSGKSDFSFLSYQQRGFDTPSLVNYMESHDEERLMYKNLEFGNSSGGYSVKDLTNALQRNEMAAVFFFSIPGPKMLWQFGELGYDFSINRCVNGEVNNCRLDRKPIRWDYRMDDRRKQLFDVFAQMIELKKTDELFKTDDFALDVAGPMKTIRLHDEGRHALVIGNFDVTERIADISFDQDGMWYDFFTGDSILVVDGRHTITMAPGEYFLFFNDRQNITTTIPTLESLGIRVNIFPNPADQFVTVSVNGKLEPSIHLELLSLSGKQLLSRTISNYSSDDHKEIINVSELSRGVFIIRLSSHEGSSVYPITIH